MKRNGSRLKDRVLELMEANRSTPVSGEYLAGELGVTRTAVWKAIAELKEQGYRINGQRRRGYILEESSDVLSEDAIRQMLGAEAEGIPVQVFDTIDSTNRLAKELAARGTAHGTLIVADSQTSGRGRRGHTFYSPAGTGVYFTIVFRADTDFSNGIYYTTKAATAVSHAVEQVLPDCKAKIKWVNDIYVDDRKICGILSEAVTDMETGRIAYVVCGIGINVNTEAFPEDVTVAGSLISGRNTDEIPYGIRNRLVAEVWKEMVPWALDPEEHSFMKEYRERSMLIGRKVVYTFGEEMLEAEAVDITEDGAMVLKKPDGEIITVTSGDCSVKPAK